MRIWHFLNILLQKRGKHLVLSWSAVIEGASSFHSEAKIPRN
jgi:hypothetical protein